MHCTYADGKAEFVSPNVSAISIIREVISHKATAQNVQLRLSSDANDEGARYILGLLFRKLEHQLQLSAKVQMIEPLRELVSQESGSAFLSNEYRAILAGADEIEAEYQKHPALQERLTGMITDLFIDHHKMKGAEVKSRVPDLQAALEGGVELEDVEAFFELESEF